MANSKGRRKLRRLPEHSVKKPTEPTPNSNEQESQGEKSGHSNTTSTRSNIMNVDQTKSQTSKTANQTKPYFQDLKERFKRQFRKPKFFIELLALLGLIAYTCETHRTNNLTQEGLNNVRDQVRPYIFTRYDVKGSRPPQPGEDPQRAYREAFDEQLERDHELTFDIDLVNAGTSPARITSISTIQLAVGDDAVETAKNCSIPYSPDNQVLAPQGLSPQRGGLTLTAVRTGKFTDEQLSKIRDINGNFRAVVFGGVKYTSLRGGDYFTQYCYVWAPKGMIAGACGGCDDSN
jgi:hypothetical protein